MFKRRQLAESKKKRAASGDSGAPRNPLDADLHANLQRVKEETGFSNDLVVRELRVGKEGLKAAAVFFDNLIDKALVGKLVLQGIMSGDAEAAGGGSGGEVDVLETIKDRMLSVGEASIVREWNECLMGLLNGDTAILVDGQPGAILANTQGGEHRSVDEPSSEVLIRGPKEGFTESIATNVSLVRRRLKTPNLWMDSYKLGRVTQTNVVILYLKGIANEKIVEETKRRLERIDVDGILESGNIQELIRDNPFSLFPTIHSTERPDSVAAHLLEGRVAIFVNGTPFVLVVPVTFSMFFVSPEDYYQSFHFAIFVRFLRFVSLMISMLGPSIYVAAISYHQEMIPTSLLISLAAQREEVPFPALIEALIMEGSFEILREAGVRMPRAIGQAVSIVGALVLGQAAVQAGIVSSAMVIVVAITGIASFTTPAYSAGISIRLLRFLIMFAAGTFGFFGIALSGIVISAHIAGLRSFGVPYLAPFGPFIRSDQKDALLRLPIWTFRKRPRLISQANRTRMSGDNEPSPKNSSREGDSDES